MDYKKKYDQSLKGKYRTGKYVAKRRGLAWELTFEQYSALILGGVCGYCTQTLNPFGTSLDRKNNEEGYTANNCIASCRRCNTLKSDKITHKEMKIIANFLRIFRDEI